MDENKKNITKMTFRISEVAIDEVSLLPHKIKILPPGEEGFIIETTVSLNIAAEEKKIEIGVWVKLFTDREKTNFLGEIKVRTVFIIESLPELKIYENLVQIPEMIMANFISIAISTTRGVLAAYTNDTPLKDAILPPQNPMTFAKQMQVKITKDSPTLETK
jgi:hypothetical protein